MSGRTTRSKQRQEENANLAPAKSTRSSARSSSPVLSVGLRSNSPSLRSSSPAANKKGCNPSPRGRGRGRGKGRGRGTAHSQNEVKVEETEVVKTTASVSGRGRGRARGRGKAGISRAQVAKAKQLAAKLREKEDNNEGEDSDTPLSELVSKPVSRSNSHEGMENRSGEQVSEKADKTNEDSTDADAPSEAEAIAQLASQLACTDNDPWSPTDDKVVLTDEHIKQLESVLSSDGGLNNILTESHSPDDINDIGLDDNIIQVGLRVGVIYATDAY